MMGTDSFNKTEDPAGLLFEEHEVIMRAVDLAADAGKLIGKDDITYEYIVKKLLHFFRMFADKYHHQKEEDILFPEMQKKNELLGEGILSEMLDNHTDFREMVSRIGEALKKGELAGAQKLLLAYGEALRDHIAVENEELFQMIGSVFSSEEARNIHYRFMDADAALGREEKKKMVKALDLMQRYFNDLEPEETEKKRIIS